MLCFPICKINLGLYITRKRDDGYHDLETVFYPVNARTTNSITGILPRDILELVPAPETSIHLSGLAVGGDSKDNLVWKAYELLKNAHAAKIGPLEIYLHKCIPMGAGLGGGSADGAYMLRAMNTLFELGLTTEQLIGHALQLGSDCPFFIHDTPQFATGRGEEMMGTDIDLSAYSIQLVCPRVHVATGKAFAMITPRPAPYDLRQLPALPLAEWKDHIGNDFEAPIFAQHPALAAIKQQLYEQGALYAAMSGSGSTVFGIFPKMQQAAIVSDAAFDTFYVP